MINPTISLQIGNFVNFPFINYKNESLIELVKSNIKLGKQDWDAFETSWDFKKSPLLTQNAASLYQAYNSWSNEALTRFNQLKSNEEELNRIFINLYGLQDELTPEEDDKEVSVPTGNILGAYTYEVVGVIKEFAKIDNADAKVTGCENANCGDVKA